MVARSVQCSAILQIADVGRRCKVMKEWCKTVQRGAKQCKGVQSSAKGCKGMQSSVKGCKVVERGGK